MPKATVAEDNVMRTIERSAPDKQSDPVVLMYPGNQLRAQVRPYDATLSAFKVMKETFFSEKE